MTRLLLATGNAHKVAEIQQILGDAWQVEARDPGVEETGDTFEENALIKARALAAATGELAVADDSGIEIDALGGAPGVRSARWTRRGRLDPPGAARARRRAGLGPGLPLRLRRGRGVAAGSGPAGRDEVVVRGTVEGAVPDAPRGTGGFGYDPVMVPVEGDGRTFAEMTDAEKHALSHRGRAFRSLLPHLA